MLKRAVNAAGSLCPGTSKKQNVTVGVLEFESTQSVMCIFEWLGKLDSARRKFRSQSVRIGNINISVPWRAAITHVPRVVRHRHGADFLEKDHRPAALHDSEEKVVGLSLKCDLKPELVAIKRKRRRHILNNKTGDIPPISGLVIYSSAQSSMGSLSAMKSFIAWISSGVWPTQSRCSLTTRS